MSLVNAVMSFVAVLFPRNSVAADAINRFINVLLKIEHKPSKKINKITKKRSERG